MSLKGSISEGNVVVHQRNNNARELPPDVSSGKEQNLVPPDVLNIYDL